jgi:hypothetical protein
LSVELLFGSVVGRRPRHPTVVLRAKSTQRHE